MRRLFFILWFPLVALLASGWLTHRLWTESKLDEWNEPATNPNLRLFRADNSDRLLVMYDEFSERREVTQTRAYFLDEHAKSPRPKFMDVRTASGLASVPFYSSPPTNSAPSLFAVAGTDGGFTIFLNGKKSGSYSLPVYDDGVGRWEKIAWTPLAMTADLTIIGGAVGCYWIYAGGPGLGR